MTRRASPPRSGDAREQSVHNTIGLVWRKVWSVTVRTWIALTVSERGGPTPTRRGSQGPHADLYELAGRAAVRFGAPASGPCLDVACGFGYGSLLLSEFGLRVIGAERDPVATRVAQGHRSGLRSVVRADAERLPFRDAAFASVVSIETIEHLREPPRFLAELRRVLRPTGVIILSTPVGGAGAELHSRYHTVEWDLRGFPSLLEENGWKVEQAGALDTSDISDRNRTGLRLLLAMLARLGVPTPLPPAATQWVIARPARDRIEPAPEYG